MSVEHELLVNAFLPLTFQAHDGDEGLFVNAYGRDNLGNDYGPFLLSHSGLGSYEDFNSFQMPNAVFVRVVYIPFVDAGLTRESDFHTRGYDVFKKDAFDPTVLRPTPARISASIRQDNIKGQVSPKGEIQGTIKKQQSISAKVSQDDKVKAEVKNNQKITGVVHDE